MILDIRVLPSCTRILFENDLFLKNKTSAAQKKRALAGITNGIDHSMGVRFFMEKSRIGAEWVRAPQEM